MERFRDMRQFDEAKDNIIAKLSTLTDEQKKQVIEFFRTHNDFENRIDWNRAKSKNNPLTWKDFEDLMNEVESRKLPKEGLKDLEEGVDYVTLKSPVDFVQSYAILTHRGSVAIASNNTEPKVWTTLPTWYQKENVVDDYPLDKGSNLYGGAKWCTAMHHTDHYFNDYTKDRGILVYYIWGYKNKFAILYRNMGDSLGIVGVWDEADNEVPVKDTAEKIRELNKETLINLIEERCGEMKNSEDRIKAIEQWGEDLVCAFEEFRGSDDDIPYDEIDNYYITYARDSEELYMNLDTTVDSNMLHDWCDLEAVGEDIWESEEQSMSEEELKEIYPQYWESYYDDWDVDYEELARNYIDEFLPNYNYLYLSDLRDKYKFIYDRIDFDNMAESDGYALYNGYWFWAGW